MARIRSDILYKQKVKEVKENQRQAKRLHIAQPVLNNQESDNLDEEDEEEDESIICEEDLEVSDWEEEDNINSDKKTYNSDEEVVDDCFYWSEICANWIDLTNQENQFDHEEDNYLLEMAHSFHAAGRNIHPADDETAKWKLEYLFKENLKAPTFLGVEFNSNNSMEI